MQEVSREAYLAEEAMKHSIDDMIEYAEGATNFQVDALWMTLMAREIVRLRGVVEDAQPTTIKSD